MDFLDNLDKDLEKKLKIAIAKCDPKLVQILLGPGCCQLWQYWLIRAIFNYDMLSMFKTVKCEFPLSIAEKQLKALEGKSHIDNKQLQNIQEQEKESFLERIRVFYDCERKLQIQGQEHAQLEASAFAGGVLQQYERKNMDCQTSIESAVSMNLTEESAAMIEKVSMECEKRVEDACSVNDLRRALVEEKNNLEGRKKVLSSQIVQVKDNIMDEMRDGKFLDKALVKSLYVRLLDHYLKNDAEKGDNPLHGYVNRRQDAKKLLLESRRQYTGFGGYIRGAASQYKDASRENKKNLLNIIRVLALNGTHSEGLADVFFSKNVTDQQLRTLGLQSIFTHMREAHNALFDKEVKDDFMKFMSAIVSEDGEFRNTAESVPIFRHTGSSLMKTVLENLDEVIEKIKKGERDGGLLSNFWDMLGRVFSNSSGKRREGMNERTSEILYEVLEVSYLAIATGDDRVMVDYAREIKERKDSEKDEDIIAIYNIIYPIFEKYKDTEKEGKAEEIEKWGNFWYHFQNVFSKSCESLEEGRFNTFFGSVWADIIGSVKTVPKEYQNYKAGHSTGGFEGVEAQKLPGNNLINWSEATHEGIKQAADEETKQAKERADQEAQARQSAERKAERESKRAEHTEVISAVFSEVVFDSDMDKELRKITLKSQINIVKTVVQHVIEHDSSPEQVLNAIIEEIKCNKNQVLKDSIINAKLIEAGIKNFSSQGTLLSSVNVSQGVSAGVGK